MSAADTQKILSKLKEFNDSATGDGLRLADNQLQQIQELVGGNINDLEIKLNLLFQLLKWPVGMLSNLFSFSDQLIFFSLDKIFPILDIMRLLVLNPTICKYLLENEKKTTDFIAQIFPYLQPDQSVNSMLIFRIFTNLFSNNLGEKYLIQNYNSILAKTLICLPLSKKNTQIALTNVILNYCIYAYLNNDQHLSKYLYECYRELVDVQLESDGAKRLLLGLGTLFHTNAELVLDVRTTLDNNAKRFFTSLDRSAAQLSSDTLQCLEGCRRLLETL